MESSRSDPSPIVEPPSSTDPQPSWRPLILAVFLAGLIIVPRSASIAVSHSESFDDSFHYERGMAFMTGDASRAVVEDKLWFNDPPLGEALNALPIYVLNRLYGRPSTSIDLYAHPLGRETVVAIIAVWKSLLFLPMVGVVFAWTCSLYGTRSAWLATAMLAIEPTFAAHIPTGAVDSYGVEAVVISAYLACRFFERPTFRRAAWLGLSTGVALMIKHTSVILPVVYVAYAGLEWFVRPWREGLAWGAWKEAVPRRLGLVACVIGVTVLSLWAATLFDVSTPLRSFPPRGKTDPLGLRKLARQGWPAGIYFFSFIGGFSHSRAGHMSYLWGERRMQGWWYYFPAVATYKIPLGVAWVILLGVISLRKTRPKWDEWALILPWSGLTLLLVTSKVNIGFRHYLAPYVFLLMFASRCVVAPGRWRIGLAWLGVAIASAHAASFHPDTMSYINFPRKAAYLQITDSNIDWGQSVKQIGQWLDRHPQTGRPVYLCYFGKDQGAFDFYLKGRVTFVKEKDPVPDGPGLLFLSPCELVYYDEYKEFLPIEPTDIIGHGSMLVYDLDLIRRPRATGP